jgi:hypothetical protein
MLNRRAFIARTGGLVVAGLAGARAGLYALDGALQSSADPTITIYKSKSCGCCTKWVDHLKASRFGVVVHDREEMDEVKDWLGVPRDLRSCHTGQVGGYVIEGHVPASDIRAALAKKPKIAGLAVPGMPTGSPGMEVPGKKADAYEVIAYKQDGTTQVFARH